MRLVIGLGVLKIWKRCVKMNDPRIREAEKKGDELSAYSDWIDNNEEHIIECYVAQLVDFPENIYEGVLDDDYEEAENKYCENLTIKEVDDGFIKKMYNKLMENGEEE